MPNAVGVIQIVCFSCDGNGCARCLGSGAVSGFPLPGSLTAARLRLADAAEAKEKALRAWEAVGRKFENSPQGLAWSEAVDEYNAAEAALRTKRAGG